MMPHPQIRTGSRNRTRTRRLSACNRHPSEPVTGFCALCLRDRLAGLDSSSPAPPPELRRSKSVAAERCEVLTDLVSDPQRNSCDVRARSTLSDLFVVGGTKKLGFSSVAEPVLETKDSGDEEDDDDDDGDREIRVSDDVIGRNEIDDDEAIEGDLKTMKEIIDMELKLETKRRNNFVPAASIFSQKLQKWRNKQKQKKQSRCINGGTDNARSKLGQLSQIRDTQSEVADYGFGRRSCDTEPRFSIDAHRLSVEDPRFSLDEHRASWDGYMMARTTPRLTPMLSIDDNMTLAPANRVTNSTMENLQMDSIREDNVKYASVSDYSSSNRGNGSSAMKSSSTKTAGFGGDDVKSASNARVSPASDVIFQGTKLVITEKELKDWHLNSIKNNNNNINNNIESASNAPDSTSKTSAMNMMNIKSPSSEQKKKAMLSKWRKVCNLWGHKQKIDDKNGDRKKLEHIPETRVVRNPSSVNSRTRRYSISDVNSGLLKLYLTPFRNSRRNKSAKIRAPSMAINGWQLH